jgi:putative heme-binding domain-containing protein
VIGESRMPKVSRFIARRLTAEIEHNPAAVDALVEQLAASKDDATTQAILVGMNDALRGWLKAPRPAGWEPVAARLEKQTSGEGRQLVQELSLVFGSGRAVDQLRSIAADKNQPAEARRQAIRSLAAARTPDLAPLLRKLLGDNDVAEEAARGLSAANPPDLSTALLAAYPRLREAGKLAIVEALAARPETAAALLAAVDEDKVAREHVQPFVVRQMQLLGSADVQQKIEQLWPELKLISGDKLAQIAAFQKELAGDSLASADAARGRKLFEQSCAKCHKLFGRGESIGPELTGAQRTNLNYWLENIVDPSAQVAANFRMSIVLVDDGRVLNGVALQQTDRTLTLQTPTERLVLDRRNIEAIRPSQLSLMPEGLLNQLSDQQRRDLFAYLMAPRDPVAGVGHTDASHAGKPMSQ